MIKITEKTNKYMKENYDEISPGYYLDKKNIFERNKEIKEIYKLRMR